MANKKTDHVLFFNIFQPEKYLCVNIFRRIILVRDVLIPILALDIVYSKPKYQYWIGFNNMKSEHHFWCA